MQYPDFWIQDDNLQDIYKKSTALSVDCRAIQEQQITENFQFTLTSMQKSCWNSSFIIVASASISPDELEQTIER